MLQWWDEWLTGTTKLRHIKTTIGARTSSSRTSRREEVIIARLRIGHCIFDDVRLLRGSICDTCGEPLSAQHLVLQCRRSVRTDNNNFIQNQQNYLGWINGCIL